jgi:hypothetical protein
MWRESIHETPFRGLKFLVYYKTWQNYRFTTAVFFVFSCHLAMLNVSTLFWPVFERVFYRIGPQSSPFLSFFLIVTSFYVLTVGVKGYFYA